MLSEDDAVKHTSAEMHYKFLANVVLDNVCFAPNYPNNVFLFFYK